MNEKRPAIPPPRTRPLSETLPRPSVPREPAAPESAPPEARRRRRYSEPRPEAPPADPLVDDEGFSMKRLLRSLAAYLLMIAVLGGLIYFYMRFMEQEAATAGTVDAGLRAIGQELWIKGVASGVSAPDPRLDATISRIKKALPAAPFISILPADGVPSEKAITHEILYASGSRTVLTVRVFADVEAGTVDIVSFDAAPQFKEEGEAGAPAKTEETLKDKLKKFGIDEKILQNP